MLIRFSRPKGTPVLTCVRDDGTMTWSKSAHGGFFGPHDLMHYAVETTLGMRRAFFGLIAEGWEVTTFAELGAARLPAEALHAEQIVNLLLQEASEAEARSAEEFNATLAAAIAAARKPQPAVTMLTELQLRRIRERFAELSARYRSLGEGASLEVQFPWDGNSLAGAGLGDGR